MSGQFPKRTRRHRRAATLVLPVVILIVLSGLVVLAARLGNVILVRTQLQVAADSAAAAAVMNLGKGFTDVLAAARRSARYHVVVGSTVELDSHDVEVGVWHSGTRTFTPAVGTANAVRVTARPRASSSGRPAHLFAGLLGGTRFDGSLSASAVTTANPRDIAFVVDLSGSMNDDTEPCWATQALNETFAAEGSSSMGDELVQALYDDFGFGPFPGALEWLGEPAGVPAGEDAYAELTEDGGLLSKRSVPWQYRIEPDDSQTTRKRKAYSMLIDTQIARVMPNAKPTPDSSLHYKYWEKYLDYIVQAGKSVPKNFQGRVGYRTYVQFMMDHGRNKRPDGAQYTPLSAYSPHCPWHAETTAAGTFRFPPREQPVHSVRRALIAALGHLKRRNAGVAEPDQADWVSIITFDSLIGGGPFLEQTLTADYDTAIEVCTRLQAATDHEQSAATESGLLLAREHLGPEHKGGRGRESASKVVVLITKGAPDLYVTSDSEINSFIRDNPSDDFYSRGKHAYSAPLVQAARMRKESWQVFPVGVGQGADYDFIDRLARMGGTSNNAGQCLRASGNPAEYEPRLNEILERIITSPQVRLVQ